VKFIAILKDSLREAIDAKVFYVMVGLSAVLTLLAATVTFTPKPAGKEFMQFAALPLFMDNPDDLDLERMMKAVMVNRRDVFEVVSTEPVGGAPDAPDSPFRVVVRALPVSGAGKAQPAKDPAAVAELIRDHFGVLDTLRLVDVTDVRPVGRPAGADQKMPGELFYELDARPTPSPAATGPTISACSSAPCPSARAVSRSPSSCSSLKTGWWAASGPGSPCS
jgi:hypothetical protein